MESSRGLVLPLDGEPDLPWSHFVLEAARGGVRVPEWLLLAVPGAVGARLGLAPSAVDAEAIERALALLPRDPAPALGVLLGAVGGAVPAAASTARLPEEAVLGGFRPAVPIPDLLHDAARAVRADYGRDGFFRCTDAVFEAERWSAVAAVAAMMYLILLRG